MFMPRTCPLCRRGGPAPCAACAVELERAPSLPAPAGVDRCVAVLGYEGAGRELVARLKYRNARDPVRWLATEMAALVDRNAVDVVTWVPTTSIRRRDRGFDQAEVLARAVARKLGRPCRPLLRRAAGPPQTGRSLLERRVGPALTAASAARRGQRVLLVDDVITTGTTVRVAAQALRTAGFESVSVLAAARTPLKRTRSDSETLVQ